MEGFLETPYDLQGKDVSDLLSKRRPRRRRALSPDTDDDEEPKRRREKKKKEDKQYKSATFIEDSDAEYGDIDKFLEKERVLRERMASTAAASGKVATMKATGTKKRRRRREETVIGKKRKGREELAKTGKDDKDEPSEESDGAKSAAASPEPVDRASPPKRLSRPRPRPRPRQTFRAKTSDSGAVSEQGSPGHHQSDGESPGETGESTKTMRRRNRMVVSDDE